MMCGHEILLRSEEQFAGRLPPHHVGLFLADLPLVVRGAVSMAFRNRSTAPGKRPAWLERASDVRLVDIGKNGESILYFEAPSLGDVASEVYEQKSIWPEFDGRPAPDDTAFDVLGDVLSDVAGREADSSRFDTRLLDRIASFRRVFKESPLSEIDVTSRRYPRRSPARLNPAVIDSVNSLLGTTPVPQRVRIVGNLDGLVASTQRFSILLDNGEKASGVFAEDQADAMQSLWRQRVLVLGTAIYRASGRLLRIEADRVKPGESEPSVFSRIPAAPGRKVDVSRLRKPQGPKSGIAAIIGKWPGDESDEEIEAAFGRLS